MLPASLPCEFHIAVAEAAGRALGYRAIGSDQLKGVTAVAAAVAGQVRISYVSVKRYKNVRGSACVQIGCRRLLRSEARKCAS